MTSTMRRVFTYHNHLATNCRLPTAPSSGTRGMAPMPCPTGRCTCLQEMMAQVTMHSLLTSLVHLVVHAQIIHHLHLLSTIGVGPSHSSDTAQSSGPPSSWDQSKAICFRMGHVCMKWCVNVANLFFQALSLCVSYQSPPSSVDSTGPLWGYDRPQCPSCRLHHSTTVHHRLMLCLRWKVACHDSRVSGFSRKG